MYCNNAVVVPVTQLQRHGGQQPCTKPQELEQDGLPFTEGAERREGSEGQMSDFHYSMMSC